MKFSHLFSLSLGIGLLGITPGFQLSNQASEAENPPLGGVIVEASSQLTHEKILKELEETDIIYLGEIHDRPEDHQAKIQILTYLSEKNPNLVIGLEMFQRPFQGVIDEYLAGNITEEELIIKTEYEERWGFPYSYYAPILRFAKKHQIPVLALNTPTEITRQVAKSGLSSLTIDQQKYVPSIEDIDLSNEEYRKLIQEIYGAHGGHGNSLNFENFFAAQVLWDETMAEKIAEYYQNNPNSQIITIAGRLHIAYNYGIPDRVSRRLNQQDLVQKSVLFVSQEEGEIEQSVADYLWQH